MPSSVPSVKVVKSFPFKGGERIFSNRYHFSGGTPSDATRWNNLFDDVVAGEFTLYAGDTTITECVGYAAGSDLPVASKLFNFTGNLSPGSGVAKAPGECAALVRYTTNARTVKNHPIYLFNYYHSVFVDTAAGGQDTLEPNQHTVFTTFANKWLTGFTDGTLQYKRCSPHGAGALTAFVENHVTHRDFPYSPSA